MARVSKEKHKILAIDDSNVSLVSLRLYLTQMGLLTYEADNAKDGIKLAIETQPDLILLDVMMPNMDGYEACRQLKADERTEHIPVIFISARNEPSDKVKGLNAGAIDYVTKPFNPDELMARIGTAVQMVSLQDQLRLQANTDELTGLVNRRRFMDILDREVLRAKLHGGALCVVMLDIDHFKHINDTYGHLGGDIALRQLSDVLAKSVRPLDIVARYGGEEFVIIMPNTPADKAMLATDRIRQLIMKRQWKFTAEPVTLTVSMGLAMLTSFGLGTPTELIKHADAALYAAKYRGRNCVVRWDDCEQAKQDKSEHDQKGELDLQAKVVSLKRKLFQQAQSCALALTSALESKDVSLAHHSSNVQNYAKSIAEELALEPDFVSMVSLAGQLHNLWQLTNTGEYLRISEPLASERAQVLAKRAVETSEILKPFDIFDKQIQIIKYHHEAFSGDGFPDGLKGNHIPFGARILAVADAFDDLTAQEGLSCSQALEHIQGQVSELYDGDVVDALIKAQARQGDNWPLEHNSLAQAELVNQA